MRKKLFNENENIKFSERLKIEKSWLSNKEQLICDYLKENSVDVIHMSISELAERCKASEGAIVRVAQKLNYKGFQAMKISIAQESLKPSSQIFEALSSEDTIPSIIQKVFQSSIESLNETLKILDPSNMNDAVLAIKNAQKLVFYGMGGSNIIAQDAQHKFMRIGFLPYVFQDSNIQSMSAVMLSRNDVIVIISHSGASRIMLEIAEEAKKRGAKIITITNYSRCPLLKFTDIPLYTSSPETAFKAEAVSSRISELAIIDSLFISVSLQQYDKALEYMKATREIQATKKI